MIASIGAGAIGLTATLEEPFPGLGVTDGQCEFVAGFAVVGGEGVVSHEEPIADGDALFGEDSDEGRDGAGVRFRLTGLAQFAGVDGRRAVRWLSCRT